MQPEEERRRQIGIRKIDGAIDFDQLFQLLCRAEPLHAALHIAADRVPEVLLRDFVAALGRPVGKAQAEVGVDDALSAARDLIEQPAEAIAEAGGDAVWEDREEFQEADCERNADAA